MLIIAVMPCLDEALLVRRAAASLLDGHAADAHELHLVVVDNGSTDGTLDILENMHLARPGQVHVAYEPMRGFVPPRRRGVEVATRIAALRGAAPAEVLVLQTDADTFYRPGYAAAMAHAMGERHGVLLEGAISRPADFVAAHPKYVSAERRVDAGIESLEAGDDEDVVIDDKVSGFRLSDWDTWGGLFAETTSEGDDIHAETTRMFIRARLRHSARKVRVNPAGAMPSRRRVMQEPRLQFATIGFPRERSWIAERLRRWSPSSVDAFAMGVLEACEGEAVALRTAHLIALFRYLPALVGSAASDVGGPALEPDVAAALALVPSRSRDDIAEHPGAAVLDVLRLIDSHPALFAWSARAPGEPSVCTATCRLDPTSSTSLERGGS